MTTKVIHVSEMSNHPGAVYVGRAVPRRGIKASKWANPFRISANMTRFDVIDNYDAHITAGAGVGLLADLSELRGKPLACWCRRDGEERTDDNACHADVLCDLLEHYTDDELRAMGGRT